MSNSKVCPKCGEEKPISAFGNDSKASDGLYWCCRECKKIVGKEYRERVKSIPKTSYPDSKWCPKCQLNLPSSEFVKDATTLDGLSGHCKECRRRYQVEIRTKRRLEAKGVTREIKYCPQCQKDLPANEFSRDIGSPDGLKGWCKGCSSQDWRRKREEVLRIYGGENPCCACCGEATFEFLMLDHVRNDGGTHRRAMKAEGTTLYGWLRKHGYPEGFQVLCANCNCAKAFYGSCPHERHKR